MILIADSGGTKVEWCLIDGDKVLERFTVPGMNAMMLSAEQMTHRIADEVLPKISQWRDSINEVHFYGAGCVSAKVCDSVREAISTNIPSACEIEVVSDLLGSARALCGDNPGIVCILGTGSNSCYYDGKQIIDNVSPLGFILGDEGSGAYLGKVLVGDVLKYQLPEDLCRKFLDEYDLDAVKIVQRVYREPYPNRFLASLTPFLSANIEHHSIRELVLRAFDAFFKRNICHYSEHKAYKVGCCGSIAYVFNDLLAEAAAAHGFALGTTIKAPMDGLIKYHS